jgi:hypothetical protein
MGRPAFLIESVYNPRIHPDHVLDASSTATDKDVRALSAGRRRRDLSGWFADDLNTDAWVESTFDRIRAFDCLWIDRDHNLDGESLSVTLSDDDFTTSQTIGPLTVPSASQPHSRLESGLIVRTNEGALIWYLGLQAAWAVRVEISAMGTGLRPELAGLALGLLWRPRHAPVKTFDFGNPNLIIDESRTAHAHATSSEVGSFRDGRIHLRLDQDEELTGRYPVEDLYLSAPGHGAVVIHDDEQAERALFSRAPAGRHGFEIRSGQWAWPQIEIPVSEVDPVIR